VVNTFNKPATLLLWLRSLLFWLLLAPLTILFACLVLLAFFLPLPARWWIISLWVTIVLWWLRVTCGLRHEITGLENIPDHAAIVFSKHQSMWETIALQTVFKHQVWVAKQELKWLPFFGWGLWLMKTIFIKRGTGRAAVQQLVTQGKQRLAEGIWVIIFPEGTRVDPGMRGRYRIGGAVLAEQSGFPIVPVAHNSGEFWPRRSFIKFPGTIQVRIGAPIMTSGKTPQQILDEASAWIECQMDEITTLKGNSRENSVPD
jgi:1-acyl-sn-glycerol-3-phosphate acyltransferase